jgi:hypothetical protein
MVIVRYVDQGKLDLAQSLRGRDLTWTEIDRMKTAVSVPSPRAAERLVEHLRLTGCLAGIEEACQA